MKRRHKTTKGVELQCELEDGSTQWFPLKELKESDPVTVALYANKMGLTKLPAFFWWVPHTLKKKKHIEKAIIARVHATKFKFGIEVPQNYNHAKELDIKNGNNDWDKAVEKEMDGIQIAFDILEDDEPLPKGYTKAEGFLIFDVKMDFTKKA